VKTVRETHSTFAFEIVIDDRQRYLPQGREREEVLGASCVEDLMPVLAQVGRERGAKVDVTVHQ